MVCYISCRNIYYIFYPSCLPVHSILLYFFSILFLKIHRLSVVNTATVLDQCYRHPGHSTLGICDHEWSLYGHWRTKYQGSYATIWNDGISQHDAALPRRPYELSGQWYRYITRHVLPGTSLGWESYHYTRPV